MPSRRAAPRPPILLLTRIWPTPERPSVGSFIRARASGVPGLRVVRPRWYRLPRILIYAVLLVDALRAGPRIRGVEAHMLVPTGLVGLLVARLRGVPLVVYAHGGDVRDWRRTFVSRALARYVARRADGLVTNSRDTAGYLVEMGGRPVVVPPGIDLARFAPTPRPAQRRVLYLGGRNPRKGYDVARRLADTLVGPWLRDVEPGEVPSLLAAHDVVLMPSRAEPFGLVAVEAIASGRWVVAGDVGGLRDIITDGVNGTLVSDDDFATALVRVPDYDPDRIATTVERFSLGSWQSAMAGIWDEAAPFETPEATGQRRVAMLVRNAYTHDTRVEKEARTLTEAGYRVTVVADSAPGLPEREARGGSDVVRVARRGPPVPGLRFLLHQWRLAGVLHGLRPDILHAHDSNALLPVAVAARRTRAPFVYDAHDLWLGRPRRERSRAYFALNQAWYTVVERLLVPRAAATITVSPPIVRHLRDRYRLRRVALVPNYPRHEPEGGIGELRDLPAGEALDPALPVVLYLGGLMEGRGLEQLVDAIGLLSQSQLVLLGDGGLSGALVRRASDAGFAGRLHVLPPVASDAVIAYAASADVGVSPIVPSCLNYRYSLPNKLFQYMAAGIPVVASDFPQVREIIESARCGIVADMRRPAAIAGAMKAVLADAAEARAMGQRGRAAVAERYNWSTAAATLLETYAELPPRNGPSATVRNS